MKTAIFKYILVILLSCFGISSFAANTITVTVLTDPTTNGTANANIYDNTAGLAVIGFKIVVTGSPNINNIYINTSVPSTYNLDDIFTSTTRNLVRVSTANYATATILSASSGNVNTAVSGGFDQYVINFNNSISAGTYYYFLVLKSSYMNTIPQTIQFTMNTSSFTFNSPSATVSLSSPTTTVYSLYGNDIYWLGSTDTNWDNAANWYTLSSGVYNAAGRVPAATDNVNIGYKYQTNNLNPTLSSTSPTVYSISFGTLTAADGTCRLTINGQTLTVTSTISKDHTTNNTRSVVTISGTGTLNCVNVTIGNSNVPANAASVQQDSTVINSRISNFNISGNMTFTSNASADGSACYFPAFNVDANNVTLSGSIIMQDNSNSISSTYSTTFSFPTRARFNCNHSNNANTVTFNGLTPILSVGTDEGVDMNSQGSTLGTVVYNSSSDGQIVYTHADSYIGSVGGNYQNLTLSNTGKKVFHGSTVSISGDFTSGNGIVDMSTNNPTVTVTGNWVNSSTVNQGTGSITIGGSVTNSGNLNLGSGNLTIAGSYTNSANYTQSTGTTTFNGASPTLTDSGNGTMFNKVNFSGSGTALLNAGNFSVSTTGVLTLSNNTTLNANGHLLLYSSATSSASIAAIPTGSSITNNVSVQRYFQGSSTYDSAKGRWKARGYRIISSPVNTGTLVNTNRVYALNYIVGATAGLTTTASSTTNAFVTGATGGSTSAGNPTLYLYRENIAFSNASFTSGNFRGITNITSPSSLTTSDGTGFSIPIGNGVFFFFRGNATSYSSRTTGSFIAPENTILTTTGNINQGSVTVKDWFTPGSGTLSYTTTIPANTNIKGFNMVGNPYPCSIDWNTINSGGITATSISPTIYVFNPVTNQYDTYVSTGASTGTGTGNATSIIASGQGFFVKAGSGASLIFNESAKSLTQPANSTLLMGKPADQNAVLQQLRLKLTLDSLNYNDIVIAFNPKASDKYSVMEDGEYFLGVGALVNLSSLSSDNVNLAVNFLPLPAKKQTNIRLNAGATRSGQYKLERTALDAVPEIYEVWLMDKYKKDSLDIRHNSTYIFNINKSDTASFGSNRFEVVIRENSALGLHLLNFAAAKTVPGSQITWKTENEQNYTYFTVEKSTDNGQTFSALGGTQSTGAGAYSFLDKNTGNIVDEYRLKLEDINGTVTYSKVVSLDYSHAGNSVASNINIYPNPAVATINLSIIGNNANLNAAKIQNANLLSNLASERVTNQIANTAVSTGSYKIDIVSSSGAVIKSVVSTQANYQTDVSRLVPGTYIIHVTNNADKSLVGKGTFVKL